MFEYSQSFDLEVTSVEPSSASTILVTELTITGLNFGTILSHIRVKIGPEECHPTELENTQIKCKFLGGPKG